KLNGANYRAWKFQMRLALKSAGLLDIVEGREIKPTVDPDDWIKNDDKSQSIIANSLVESQLNIITSCTSSYAMWKKITSTYEDKSDFSIQLAYATYYSYRISRNKSLVEAYNE